MNKQSKSFKKLLIAISTFNARIENIGLPPPRDGVGYIIVHQKTSCNLKYAIPSETVDRDDVDYISVQQTGLSKSRNLALLRANSTYIHFMDDDVLFDLDALLALIEEMSKYGADVATAKFIFESGAMPKSYKNSSFDHGVISAAKVSSIEICAKVKSLKRVSVSFDERFGLGSKLPSGEEYIFLADCLRMGLRVRYVPITIGTHPDFTSGQDFFSNASKVIAKREMIKRVFGVYWPLLVLLFWAKKIKVVRRSGYFLLFTRSILLGWE